MKKLKDKSYNSNLYYSIEVVYILSKDELALVNMNQIKIDLKKKIITIPIIMNKNYKNISYNDIASIGWL